MGRHQWVKFSTAKTVSLCIHYCRLRKFQSDPQLLLNGSPIPVVEEVKFLSIIFDKKNSHFLLTCVTWKINAQKLLTCYALSHTPLGVQISKPYYISIDLLLWPPYVIGRHYIFALWFLSSIYLLLSSFFPRLVSAATDWISTILLHMAWP